MVIIHKLQKLRVTITPSLRGEDAHDIRVQIQTQGVEHAYTDYILNSDFESHFELVMKRATEIIKRSVANFGRPQ